MKEIFMKEHSRKKGNINKRKEREKRVKSKQARRLNV
jgi:hypothetical protein